MGKEKKRFVVLVIDDDPDDHYFIKSAIEQVGMPVEIISVFDGTQGLKYLGLTDKDAKSKRFPNLILCDINMPLMNGLSFLETIKKDIDYKNVPVCMLTTSCDIDTKGKLLALGALDCVIKPVYARNYNTILANIFNMVEPFDDLY